MAVMPELIAIYPYRPGSESAQEQQPITYDLEPLNPETREALDRFDQALYEARLPEGNFSNTARFLAAAEVPPIEETWRINNESAKFMTGFFQTEAGLAELQKMGIEVADPSNSIETKKILVAADWSTVDIKTFGRLSKESLNWAKQQFVDQLEKNDYANISGVEDPEFITIVRDPEKLTAKLQGYNLYKHYLISVRKDLNTSHGSESQKLLAKMYSWRVNHLLAGELADVYDLVANYQLAAKPQLRQSLSQLSRTFNFDFLSQPADKITEYLTRIDKYRYGVAIDGNRQTRISAALQNLLESDSPDDGTEKKAYLSEYPYSDLEKIHLDENAAKEIYEYLLDYYGLLSQQKDVDLERRGRAADGKWQVDIDSKRSVLNVDNRRGLIQVPSGRARSLVKEVTVACHEMAHIFQVENRGQVGSVRLLTIIGGSRNRLYAEAGGINWERQAMNYLFGKRRPIRAGYFKAAQELLDGGSTVKAAYAYFLASDRDETDIAALRKTAKKAFGSTLRLLAKGGQWRRESNLLSSSQPLQYAEQELVSQELSQTELVAGVSPYILNDLEAMGLFNRNQLKVPEEMPWEVLAPFIKRKLKDGEWATK